MFTTLVEGFNVKSPLTDNEVGIWLTANLPEPFNTTTPLAALALAVT
jgi:hypothetical protein